MKYVFEIKMRPDRTAEEYAMAWERASRIVQAKSGARGTRLRRKIGEPGTLLAIAEWDSKESRDQAMAELDQTDSNTRETLEAHLEYAEFSLIGEYEDAEWTVLPGPHLERSTS